MPQPLELTKSDIRNRIVVQKQEGATPRFAVYVGKPGPDAWTYAKSAADARGKANDLNSVQMVAAREGVPLKPSMSFDEWRAAYPEGSTAASSKAGKVNAKKGKGTKGRSKAAPRDHATGEADDLDDIIASIEAASVEPSAPAAEAVPALEVGCEEECEQGCETECELQDGDARKEPPEEPPATSEKVSFIESSFTTRVEYDVWLCLVGEKVSAPLPSCAAVSLYSPFTIDLLYYHHCLGHSHSSRYPTSV